MSTTHLPFAETLPNKILRDSDTSAVIAVSENGSVIHFTHLMLKNHVLKLRKQLLGAGIRNGDILALILPNCYAFVVAFLGIVSCGGIVMPLNPKLSYKEMHVTLQELSPKVVLLTQTNTTLEKDILSSKSQVFILGRLTDNGQAVFGDIEHFPPLSSKDATSEDQCLILQTSGTTGRPKTVSLTHHNLVTSITDVSKCCELSATDVGLLVMPLFHVHGLVAGLLSALATGGSVVIRSQFDAELFRQDLFRYNITWYTAVPTIHHRVVQSILADQKVPRLRFIRSCSAKLAPALARTLVQIFRCALVSAYGMTEAAHQITSTTVSSTSAQSWTIVGSSLRDGVRIVGDDGATLGSKSTGEILVKGENVIAKYRAGDEERTSFTEDGWLRTGDLGELDDEQNLTITGRRKEMINRGGEKISPHEVEEAFLLPKQVRQTCAFGIPDQDFGETVGAVLVPNTGDSKSMDWQEIDQCLEHNLAAFKRPSKIWVRPSITTNASGKIQRAHVAQQVIGSSAIEFRGSSYSFDPSTK